MDVIFYYKRQNNLDSNTKEFMLHLIKTKRKMGTFAFLWKYVGEQKEIIPNLWKIRSIRIQKNRWNLGIFWKN